MNAFSIGGLGARQVSSVSFEKYRKEELDQTTQRAVNNEGALLDYETLELRVHPPNVNVELEENETKITVDSANRPGTLVEVVQTLTELGLDISKSRITSDGGWFVDEFVVKEPGNQAVTCDKKLETIKKVLNVNFEIDDSIVSGGDSFASGGASTVFELAGQDRSGLLADVMAKLMSNGCIVRSAAVWSYKDRVAFVLSVTEMGAPLQDSTKIERLRQVLMEMMDDESIVRVCDVQKQRQIHHDRKIHQLLLSEEIREYDYSLDQFWAAGKAAEADTPYTNKNFQPMVSVTFASQSKYWFVTIRCVDRNKLMFDIVCTLADMDYDVYHATVDSEPALEDQPRVANQEFYIRPRLGGREWDQAKADRLRAMLRASIMRRFPKGIKVRVQNTKNLDLTQLAQTFKQHDLTITRAKVKPQGIGFTGHTFYLMAMNGGPADRSQVQDACCRVGGNFSAHTDMGSISPNDPDHKFSFSLIESNWKELCSGKGISPPAVMSFDGSV